MTRLLIFKIISFISFFFFQVHHLVHFFVLYSDVICYSIDGLSLQKTKGNLIILYPLRMKYYHTTYFIFLMLMRKKYCYVCLKKIFVFHHRYGLDSIAHAISQRNVNERFSTNNICCQSLLKALQYLSISNVRDKFCSKLISFANFLPSLLESTHLAHRCNPI